MNLLIQPSDKWRWHESPTGEPVYKPPLHGIHNSLFGFACRCAEEEYSEEETRQFILEGIRTHVMRRDVEEYEVRSQIRNAFNKINGTSYLEEEPRYTTARYNYRDALAVFEDRQASVEDLKALSSADIPFDSKAVLQDLFAEDDWVNLGFSKKKTVTLRLKDWLQHPQFNQLELLVPNPMTGKHGTTRSGLAKRPRTRANTSPRRWVIIDLDEPDKEWQPSLILELAEYSGELPALVVSTGGKGLHAWWSITGSSEEAVQDFEDEAIRLGTDRVFIGENSRMQMCRLPLATRKENGNLQEILLWNL